MREEEEQEKSVESSVGDDLGPCVPSSGELECDVE